MDYELPDDFAGDNKALVRCITAAGILDLEDVIEMAEPGRTLLLAAGARLEDAAIKATEQYNEGFKAGVDAQRSASNAEEACIRLDTLIKRFGYPAGTDVFAWLEHELQRLQNLEQQPESPSAALAERHNAHEQAMRDGYDAGIKQATNRAENWVAMHMGDSRKADIRAYLMSDLAAPVKTDGLLILRDDVDQMENGALKQLFSVKRPDGHTHYRAIEVIKRMSGAEEDLPQYQLIEARLLRGNR